MNRWISIWLIGAAFAVSNATAAQDFTSIDLGLAGLAIPGEEYEGLWDAKRGVSGFASSIFLGGRLGLSIRVFDTETEVEDLPEFLAIHGSLGWGASVSLPMNGEVSAGGRVGAMNMRFDDDDVFTAGLQNETEITTGIFVHGQIPVVQQVAVFADVEWTRMYLERPTTFVFVEAGLRVRLDAPSWLTEVLE